MAQGRTFEDGPRARALYDQGWSCNRIARELGVSPSTISGWAKREGLSFDRSKVEAANTAHSIDLAARRGELKALLLEDALRLREQMWQPAVVFNFGGKDNTYEETTLDEPTFTDKKNIMSAVGIAIDRFEKLDARDNDGGVAAATSLLGKLAAELGLDPNLVDPEAEQ